MAIDTANLKKTIKELCSHENSAEDFANGLANALETWIKTATVTVTAPTGVIQVQGSPSAQANVEPISIAGDSATSTGGIT